MRDRFLCFCVLASSAFVAGPVAAGCVGQMDAPPKVGPAPLQTEAATATTAPVAAPVASAPPAGSSGPLAAGWETFGAELKGKLFESALHDWSRTTQCTAFDYFPNGGIQNFWCHRAATVTLEGVRKLAGVDLFSSGPHPTGSLVLNSRQSFGHYNPAFVRWLVDHASPGPNGSPAQKATREAYEDYMRPLAEIFWRTYQKAKSEEACFVKERTLYATLLARKSVPPGFHERWYYFMSPAFCASIAGRPGDPGADLRIAKAGDGGINGNAAKAVVGFWVRRSLDGTMDTFGEGLKKLIAAYQPALLEGK